jgi:tricorn protease
VPAENGYVKDMTRTSGAAERYPAWSPDGKHIAYWSDQSGEYELWLMETDKDNAKKKTDRLWRWLSLSPILVAG